jgi:hypothetical protein
MPNDNGKTPRRGGPLPPRAKRGARGPRATTPGAPPTPPVVPQELSPIAPSPQQSFRALQEAIRLGIWDYAGDIGYNPWQAMIAMALAKDTPPDLKLDCHKEVAAYLLSKLASIKVEGEVAHLHTSTSLRDLFALWEQEEEAERASLPPWTPPGFGALDMQQDADGVWDLDNEDDVED